ncbi:MAG: hypothetical protein QXD19_05540 [Candidatus Bathyarchaeia archaeon]
MMRTIEVLLVIIIIFGSFVAVSFYAVLPWPREVSPMNLRRLALTTLQLLDLNHDLSRAAFDLENDTLWGNLQIALAASLPPNVVYNLTVYKLSQVSGGRLYVMVKNISNAANLGETSDVAMYSVASANATYDVTPEKIGGNSYGSTLYILNCSDANGWWITGYTAYTLAEDLRNLLSKYFNSTVMIQTTADFAKILANQSLSGETVPNAVIINTFGEAVPIPTEYCKNPQYAAGSYANYTHFLGMKVREYNWTWCSIVGYPFYYVSNTLYFANVTNGYGIYGIKRVGTDTDVNGGRAGLTAFLQGLNGTDYAYDNTQLAYDIASSVGTVSLTQNILDSCNKYGIYPSVSQTPSRALKDTIKNYNVRIGLQIFENATVSDSLYCAGAVYNHITLGSGNITGSLLALGLTRTPDIRLTAIGLLAYYRPRLLHAEYNATETTRIVALKLGLIGGI